MKKISNISFKNYRAYFNQYKIDIPDGANVLIYGENGSGKSSMFNMLRDFLRSSVHEVNFEKNIFNTSKKGFIEIEFLDINTNIKSSFNFKCDSKTTEEFFLKQSTLTKAFLDYTDLLEIYLKSKTESNLFDLIVLSLLKDLVPVSLGYTDSVSDKYFSLRDKIFNLPKTRKSKIHIEGKNQISDFKKMLDEVLEEVFSTVNDYLQKYFSFHDLKVEYILKDMTFSYGNNTYRSNWSLETDLSISIKKHNTDLGSNFKEYLNEARLSSVALCIYLASLKMYPEVSTNYKILYLDDVFVGIDTMNRLSIIELINKEFPSYQTFISTYDRSFFLACKEKLKFEFTEKKWIALEFFISNSKIKNDLIIENPIIVKSESELEKARFYLYNNFSPDYPAAANYFRKFLEKEIIEIFPKNFFTDDDLVSTETYKLTSIVGLSNTVLNELGYVIPEYKRIQSNLFILLHPLSHYNLSTNIYKNELVALDNSISVLFEQNQLSSIVKHWSLVVGKKSTFRMTFILNQYTSFSYEFYTNRNLFYCKKQSKWSKSKLTCTRISGIKNKNPQKTITLNLSTSSIKYNCIEEAYNFICGDLAGKFSYFTKSKNMLFDVIELVE